MAARISSAAKDMMVRALASDVGDEPLQARLLIKHRLPDRRVIVRRPHRMRIAGHRTPAIILRRVAEWVPAYKTVESSSAPFDTQPTLNGRAIVLGKCGWSGMDLPAGTVVGLRIYTSTGRFLSESSDVPGVVGQYIGPGRLVTLTKADISI